MTERPSDSLAVPAALAGFRILSGPLVGQVLPVWQTPCIIGRGPENELVLPGEMVSPAHARLDARDGVWYLADLGSDHGTFIHGRQLAGEARLPAEAMVRIGELELMFEPVEHAGWRRESGRRSTGKRQLMADLDAAPGLHVREWVRRYWLGEVVGTLAAIGGSWLLDRLTGNPIAAAYGGSVGESIGFYGVVTLREMLQDAHAAGTRQAPYDAPAALATTRKIFLEFGPAELLDTALLRPALMGLGTQLLGRDLGVLAGKLLADVAFYLPVIAAYEWRKKSGDKRQEARED